MSWTLHDNYSDVVMLDRNNPPAEGIFYDGDHIFVAREFDDEDVDYDAGCVGYINYHMKADIFEGRQYCDALYTGYHSLVELMDDVYTTNCAIVSTSGYDAATIAELAAMVYDCEDRDLSLALERAREVLRRGGKA